MFTRVDHIDIVKNFLERKKSIGAAGLRWFFICSREDTEPM